MQELDRLDWVQLDSALSEEVKVEECSEVLKVEQAASED